jgi:UDPglucose 6-dehydrogenase
VPALRLDRRIGPAAYIQPSLGIAGGNLERDLVTLREACRARGVDPAFIETLLDLNDRRYRWALNHLGDVTNLAVWGLAYKRDTASTKNSMSLRVISEIQDRVTIRAYDPQVKRVDARVTIVPDRRAALEGADALLIMTDWPEFGEPTDFSRMRRPLAIDCVGVLRSPAGLTVRAMGRAP